MGSLPGPWSAEPGVEHTTFPEPRQGGPERSATPALALLPTPPCVAVECTLLAMTSIKPAFQRAVWLCRQTWPAASARFSRPGTLETALGSGPLLPCLTWVGGKPQTGACSSRGWGGRQPPRALWDAGLCGICCSLCPSALPDSAAGHGGKGGSLPLCWGCGRLSCRSWHCCWA